MSRPRETTNNILSDNNIMRVYMRVRCRREDHVRIDGPTAALERHLNELIIKTLPNHERRHGRGESLPEEFA